MSTFVVVLYGLCLGLVEFLCAVKSGIAREHIAYRDSGCVERQSVHAEKLAAQNYRSERAVCNAAENCDKSDCCAE